MVEVSIVPIPFAVRDDLYRDDNDRDAFDQIMSHDQNRKSPFGSRQSYPWDSPVWPEGIVDHHLQNISSAKSCLTMIRAVSSGL